MKKLSDPGYREEKRGILARIIAACTRFSRKGTAPRAMEDNIPAADSVGQEMTRVADHIRALGDKLATTDGSPLDGQDFLDGGYGRYQRALPGDDIHEDLARRTDSCITRRIRNTYREDGGYDTHEEEPMSARFAKWPREDSR
jgi:hypothetical protein